MRIHRFRARQVLLNESDDGNLVAVSSSAFRMVLPIAYAAPKAVRPLVYTCSPERHNQDSTYPISVLLPCSMPLHQRQPKHQPIEQPRVPLIRLRANV